MVGPASIRARTPAPIPTIGSRTSSNRSKGMWVLIAVPLVLAVTFVWQLAGNMFHTDAVVRQAVGVGQVALEPAPTGTRVDVVLVDRYGQETTFTGSLNLSLREPDGAVWQTTRSVSPSDFQPLSDNSLLAGRTGYSVIVNARDWARPPRRGGLGTVSITASSDDGQQAFSSQSQQRFP
jgi:hypothetical protein